MTIFVFYATGAGIFFVLRAAGFNGRDHLSRLLKAEQPALRAVRIERGDGNTQIMRPIKTWPAAKLTVQPASGGDILGVTQTPFGQSIRLRSKAPHTPSIETEILLFDNEKKIEFINRVKKDPVTTKEGVYFAFPISTTTRQFAYATQEGWVDPARDQVDPV